MSGIGLGIGHLPAISPVESTSRNPSRFEGPAFIHVRPRTQAVAFQSIPGGERKKVHYLLKKSMSKRVGYQSILDRFPRKIDTRIKQAIRSWIINPTARGVDENLQAVFGSNIDFKTLFSKEILEVFHQDWEDNLVWNQDIVQKLSRYLEALTPADFVSFISFANASGHYLLHDPYIVRKLWDLGLIQDKLTENDLLCFMTVKNKEGKSPLYFPDIARRLYPQFEEFSSNGIERLFSIKINEEDCCLLHCLGENTLNFASLLKKLGPHPIFELMKLPNKKGETPLHSLHNPKVLTHLLEVLHSKWNQEQEKWIDILCIPDEKGKTPLAQKVMVESLSFFKILRKHIRVDLLKIKVCQKEKKTVLHLIDEETIQHTRYLWEGFFAPDFVSVLQQQDAQLSTPLHYAQVYLSFFFPFLEYLPADDVYKIMSISNSLGDIPLFYLTCSEVFIHVLHLTDEHWVRLFYLKNSQGKSLLEMGYFKYFSSQCQDSLLVLELEGEDPLWLHEWKKNPFCYLEFIEFKKKLDFLDNLRSYFRTNEISDEFAHPCRPSQTWIDKQKNLKIRKQGAPSSQKEYEDRVRELNKKVESFLKDFMHNGKEKYSFMKRVLWSFIGKKEYVSEGEACNRREVCENLGIMLTKIREKQAWLGTPSYQNPKALDAYYNEILGDFEAIVEVLEKARQEKKMEYVFVMLVTLSWVEEAGRCGMAYQEEINQIALALHADSTEMETIQQFEIKVYLLLHRTIGEILVENTLWVDQLPREEKVIEGERLLHDYHQYKHAVGLSAVGDTIYRMRLDLARDRVLRKWQPQKIVRDFCEILSHMDQEKVIQWFKTQTAETFGRKKGNIKIENVEGLFIAHILEKKMNKLGLTYEQRDALIAYFISPRGAGLRFQIDMTPNEQHLISPATEVLMRKCLENNKERQEKFFEEMRKRQIPEECIPRVMKIKIKFDREMDQLASDYGIGFQPSLHGLVSRAYEDDRQKRFSRVFLDKNGKVGLFGAMFILKQLGVLDFSPEGLP